MNICGFKNPLTKRLEILYSEPLNIPPFKYSFRPEDISFISSTISSLLSNQEYLTMGKYGEMLEKDFRTYNSSKYAIATNCGTAALEIVLSCLNLEGREVLVPTNTFTATVIPVLNVGARPVFVDCDEDLGVCIDDLMKKTTRNTGAAIDVHIGGYVSPAVREIKKFCKSENIFLIEDAAHAAGSHLDGVKCGNFGIAGAFSFFSTKVLSAGEGGMIVTEEEEIYNLARIKRNHGQVVDNYVDISGNNWRMHEFLAVTALTQLKRLDENIEKRRNIAAIYDRAFDGNNKLALLQRRECTGANYYKYILKVNPPLEAKSLQRELKERFGVTLGGYVYPLPCHLQKVFKEFYQGPLPVSERLCRSHICLPIYPDMTPQEANYVAESLLSLTGGRDG